MLRGGKEVRWCVQLRPIFSACLPMSAVRIFLFDIVDICHLSIFYAYLLNCLALFAVRQPLPLVQAMPERNIFYQIPSFFPLRHIIRILML